MDIKILDLFSGGQTVSTIFRSLGFSITTVDAFCKSDIQMNILDKRILSILKQKGPFDFIWASPPCECFSVASIGTHWEKGIAKSEKAIEALLILNATLNIIKELNPYYWLIENPRGMMRKTKQLRYIPRITVTYCQYGDDRMKPTDLFGYAPSNWKPKTPCQNNDTCHIATPAGSNLGTQGRKTYLDRSAVPKSLILEIGKALLNSKLKKGINPYFIQRKNKGLFY